MNLDRILLGLLLASLVLGTVFRVTPSLRGLVPFALGGVAALLALRLFQGWVQCGSGTLPWTRLLLPALLLVETTAYLVNPGPRWLWVRVATVGALELAILGLMLRAGMQGPASPEDLLEDRFARHLEALIPPRAARLAAMEMVVLGSAFRFLAGGWQSQSAAGSFSYHRESTLAAVLPALPLFLPAELLLVGVLLKGASPWVRWTIHGLDLYGLLWILGFWHTVLTRPHRLAAGRVIFHKGILGHASVPLEAVRGEIPLPAFIEERDRKLFLRGAARFGLKGTEEVLLELTEPGLPIGFFGPGEPATRILVGVDDAKALRTALGFAPRSSTAGPKP